MREQHIQDLVRQGDAYIADGRMCKAIVYFERVLALSKSGECSVELALLRLSNISVQQGAYSEAVDYLRSVIEINPHEPRHNLALAELLYLNHQPQEACACLYDAIECPFTKDEALVLLETITQTVGGLHCLEVVPVTSIVSKRTH